MEALLPVQEEEEEGKWAEPNPRKSSIRAFKRRKNLQKPIRTNNANGEKSRNIAFEKNVIMWEEGGGYNTN